MDSLPNGITGVVSARVTNDATATLRATLTHGLASTSDGSALGSRMRGAFYGASSAHARFTSNSRCTIET